MCSRKLSLATVGPQPYGLSESGGVDIGPDIERHRLRKERDRLNAQIARLIAEDSLITELDNPLLRQEHHDAVER